MFHAQWLSWAAAVLFCAIRIVYVTGGDVNGLVRAVVGGAPYPGADDRDVHGVEQLGEPLDELAIVAAELDVKDVDGVGQGVGQELAGGPVGAVLGAAAVGSVIRAGLTAAVVSRDVAAADVAVEAPWFWMTWRMRDSMCCWENSRSARGVSTWPQFGAGTTSQRRS